MIYTYVDRVNALLLAPGSHAKILTISIDPFPVTKIRARTEFS